MMRIIVQSLMRLLALLPLRVHYVLGDFVSWLAEKVLRYREADVLINLARSFPDMKYKELHSLKHRFYKHFGEIVAETVWFGGCRSGERLHRQHLAEIVDPE
ncbi:MAG: hypothetical protein J6W82_02400, partial [Bacteroidales bacterium]|nr:hypothetical protein [Bacteroidales bacterium]